MTFVTIPPAVVTVNDFTPTDPLGVVAVTLVAFAERIAARLESIVTSEVLARFVPVIVTMVPP